MKKIFIRPRASMDLDKQALFIAQDNLQAACQLYEACEETLRSLAKMPHIGHTYPARKKELIGIRVYSIPGFKKHLIFYIPKKDRIEIIRILYASKNIKNIL